MASYYEDFMLSLKSKLPDEYSIWTLGHGGHDIPKGGENIPSLSDHGELFNLESVIKQKIDFVKANISSDQEVTLIGHSIGAKMVIEVIRANVANVKKGVKVQIKFTNDKKYLLIDVASEPKLSSARFWLDLLCKKAQLGSPCLPKSFAWLCLLYFAKKLGSARLAL